MAKRSTYCSVFGCMISSFNKPEISFFSLPSNVKRRVEWLRLINREDLADKKAKSYVVCETHFTESDILRSEQRKNLKKNAVPSLNLPSALREDQVISFDLQLRHDASTQTDRPGSIYPCHSFRHISRKRKLKMNHYKRAKLIKLSEVDTLSNEKQRETLYQLCKKFLPEDFAVLVRAQSEYSSREKATKHSLPITTEWNDKFLAILKTKAEGMREKEKNCSMIIDTINLRPNVSYHTKLDRIYGLHEVNGVQLPIHARVAIVLLVRGISVDWKLPVGFAFLSELSNYGAVSAWIDVVIEQLFQIGLRVRTLITDASSTFYNLAKYKSIVPARPFFIVKKHIKILYIFDPAHLLTLLRDDLLLYNFHFQGCVTNYEPILQFYNQDREKTCRLAPKLTNAHIKPTGSEKNDVRYAAQLLSNSVASAILTYTDFYVMDESARDAVKLIKLVNDLFDVLTSQHLNDDCELRRPFTGDTKQVDLLNDAAMFFRMLRIFDSRTNKNITESIKFIQGFQITINSVLYLFEDLKELGFPFLRTKRLNKEVSDMFLEDLRIAGGVTQLDPTSKQFVKAFRELFISYVSKPPIDRGSFLKLARLLTRGLVHEDVQNDELYDSDAQLMIDESVNRVTIKQSDYKNVDKTKGNSVVFIASHLLQKCADIHQDCKFMNSYLERSDDRSSYKSGTNIALNRYKKFVKETSETLTVIPRDDVVKSVIKMEEVFQGCFQKIRLVDLHIAEKISSKMKEKNIDFSPPCPCFPSEYFKKLFIRMRIYQTILHNNKTMKSSNSKKIFLSVPVLT